MFGQSPSPKTKLLIPLVVGAAVLVAGYEGWSAWRALDARSWVPVSGRVTQCKVERTPLAWWQKGGRRRGRRSRRTHNSKFVFEYGYSYEGVRYHNSNISHGGFENLWAPGVKRDYPQGRGLTVYVNPDNPKEAILKPGFQRAGVIAASVSVMILVFAVGNALLTYQAVTSRDPEPSLNPQTGVPAT